MQHQIPVAELGPAGDGMARAVSACVHCGFCLAACPTYRVLGEEMDSPRGRIVLMKQALEGTLDADEARPYIDRCLGCLACETACPSGVRYRDLLVPFRARVEASTRPALARAWRRVLLGTLESPRRFRAAAAAGRAARAVSRVLPGPLRAMLALLPDRLPAPVALPERVPAKGTRRARVALVAGCVQQALRPSINLATLRVLAANGVETIVPRAQGCCGALALHSGLAGHAHDLSAWHARAFPADVDAIVTNSAGCGSAMKEAAYPAPVHDVSEFLDALGLSAPLRLAGPRTIAYQDACHLSHGQGVRAAPRRLLARIDGGRLVELDDDELCCGSAGLYNLEHPETAAELGRRKAAAIRASGADLVATGNVGCLTQMTAHASGIPIRHTMEVLDGAGGT